MTEQSVLRLGALVMVLLSKVVTVCHRLPKNMAWSRTVHYCSNEKHVPKCIRKCYNSKYNKENHDFNMSPNIARFVKLKIMTILAIHAGPIGIYGAYKIFVMKCHRHKLENVINTIL